MILFEKNMLISLQLKVFSDLKGSGVLVDHKILPAKKACQRCNLN